jgi:hypothetical protein
MAQTAGSGTITGTITDPSGASVPGASVLVHNADTGADRTAQTSESGLYNATFLQPGHYDVTASKTGFAPVERKGVLVEVGRTETIDLQMTVKGGAETVTVTSEAPVVDTQKTDNSQEVDQNLVKDLPIIGRRWDNFVLLTPGVASDGALVSYRGVSGLYNNNSVDGANNNQSFFSEARGRSAATTGVPYIYSLDAIQEFQVSASNYSAEFGQAAGGVVNAVTKSGTNAMHGDLFYYLRYPSWAALDSYGKSQGIYTQSVHQLQQFGGSVGGALIKDKLFYFLNYDGSRKVFPISYTSTSNIPSLPCPTLSNGAQALTATQCSAAKTYLAGLLGAYPRTGDNDIGFGKIDYQINNNNRLSMAFDLDDYHAPNSYSSASTYNNTASLSTNGPIVLHERFFVANLDSTVSPTMINNFRFQWGVDDEVTGANSGGPNVGIASVMAYGMPNALPRPAFPDEHRLQFADTLSMTLGKHQVKMGVDVNGIHELAVNLFQGGGVYSYSGAAATAFDNWALDVYGINTGDGLTGRHYSSFAQVTDPITGVGKDDFYDWDYAWFIEDSWRLRPNLTVNLGLRYELQDVPQPTIPNTLTTLTTAYTSSINIDTNNMAPRIGIAWNPTPKTVVRAGYGMFYAKTSDSTFYAIRVENGVYQQTFNCTPSSCPALTFPNVIFNPPGPAPAAPFSGALTPRVTTFTPPAGTQLAHGLTPDFVNPMIHEGEFTVEEQLPWNSALSVGYLMGRGMHLPVFDDVNVAPTTQSHTYDVLNSSGALAQQVTVPWYTQRINPQTGVVLLGYSTLNSWYNALVVSFRKPMSHGFEALLNYTWAKSIDDGAVGGANGTFYGTDYPLNPYNQREENSLSDLNQTNRFTGSLIYAPPMFHKLTNKVARNLLDGFNFAGVITCASGEPGEVFNIMSGFPSGGVDYGVTGGEVTNSGGSTGGRPPQYGRNIYNGPALYNVDFRILRDISILDRFHLQFLGEAFNLFNHTNFSALNGTSFNYTAVGSGACTSALGAGSNGCLVPNPAFMVPTSSTSANGLYGARQLQVSAKFVF